MFYFDLEVLMIHIILYVNFRINYVIGYGVFHYKLLALCGWALSSDAIEILCISFVLPSATCELDLSDSDKGWINSSVFLGNPTPTLAILEE